MDIFGGYTAAQGRKNRKHLLHELEQDERHRYRAKIQALRQQEKQIRTERQNRLGDARKTCMERRQTTRQEADAAYKKAVEAARLERASKKRAAAAQCALERQALRADIHQRLEQTRAERKEETRFRREIRRNERAGKLHQRSRATAVERRAESDHEVVSNIPERLIPLWETVRTRIQGNRRQSRTEAFLHYAEEHPDEVLAAIERDVEKQLRAEQRRLRKEKQLKGVRKASSNVISNYHDLIDFFESVAV